MARFAKRRGASGLPTGHAEAIADFDAHLARHPAHHEARSFRLLLLNYRDDLSPEGPFAEHLAYGRAVVANIPAGCGTVPSAARMTARTSRPYLRANSKSR